MQEIIYEDNNLLVINKPAGLIVSYEKESKILKEKTLIDYVLEKKPEIKKAGSHPRYGVIHRLDKNTSGILLIAKNNDALSFFQEQFKSKKVEKKYLALITGNLKTEEGIIETLIGRSPKNRKTQKAYFLCEPETKSKRLAITKYKTLQRFIINEKEAYTLIEAQPITGRKHQIRVHLKHLNYPISGDSIYGFKNQNCPKGLNRHFLHANYMKINLPNKQTKEFQTELPSDLKKVLENLNTK